MNDDVAISLGNTEADPDAALAWDTLDEATGGAALRLVLRDGDASNVPVLAIVNEFNETVALDAFAGETNPTLAIFDGANGYYVSMQHNGTDGVFESGTGFLRLKAPSTILMQNSTTEIMRFSNDGTKTTLLAPANDYVRVGSRSVTSHSLNSEDDLLVTGELEVDLSAYFDGAVTFGSTALFNGQATFASGPKMNDNIDFRFGTGQDVSVFFSNVQTVDTLIVGLDTTSRSIIFCDKADQSTNFGKAAQTNPTLYIQSSDATSTVDAVKIWHDQTDGNVDSEAGTLNLGATGNVNFAGASRTASTVTHDAYVELEVAGTLYKFMLGS
jgi:hypothetical protein